MFYGPGDVRKSSVSRDCERIHSANVGGFDGSANFFGLQRQRGIREYEDTSGVEQMET